MATSDQQYFVEIFPVQTTALPTLTAYQVQVSAGDAAVMGGKLAYRLRQALTGNWVWLSSRLVTDTTPNPVKLMMALETVKQEQPAVFNKLITLKEDYQWRANPALLAEFIVRGALAALSVEMRAALTKTAFRFKNARVERDYRAQAWVVNEQPAVSFSVVSTLFYDPDLQTYATSVADTGVLIGLAVADKTSTLRGEIIKVLGKVDEHRQRLESLSQRQIMRDLIHSAPGDQLVVRVQSGQYEYDYIASALDVVIRLDDAHRFNVNPRQAAQALALKPEQSAQMVKVVAEIPKQAGLVANAFSTQNAPDLFTSFAPAFDVVFGGSKTRPYSAETLALDVSDHGMYWWRERFASEPLRIGLINTLGEIADDFLEAMKRVNERTFGFKTDVVRERKVRVVSQANLESAVRVIQKEALDVVLVFCGDSRELDEVDIGRYVKAQTVGRGLPCLVIDQAKLDNPDAMMGVLIGMLARAGNVPYLLDEPLPYADFVVGLSLVHEHKKDHDVLTGIARVYRSDGALMYYVVSHAPLPNGEDIPANMLGILLPGDVFGGKRVVIHNDGRLVREALWALGGWEDEISAMFYPVEIVQRDVPTLYSLCSGKIDAPGWGSTFRLGEFDALMMTAPPDDNAALPLYIHSEPLSIEQALHSVQAFTLLHYDNALQTPRLPVTVQHADTVAASVLRGVLPESLTGDTPFWL